MPTLIVHSQAWSAEEEETPKPRPKGKDNGKEQSQADGHKIGDSNHQVQTCGSASEVLP